MPGSAAIMSARGGSGSNNRQYNETDIIIGSVIGGTFALIMFISGCVVCYCVYKRRKQQTAEAIKVSNTKCRIESMLDGIPNIVDVSDRDIEQILKERHPDLTDYDLGTALRLVAQRRYAIV